MAPGQRRRDGGERREAGGLGSWGDGRREEGAPEGMGVRRRGARGARTSRAWEEV